MFLFSAALALDPAAVQQRLDAVASLRSQRIGTHAPKVSAEAYAKAAKGEFVAGVDNSTANARKVWGVGIVDAPIDRYFSAINDDRSKVAYTKLDHVALLEGSYCGTDRIVFQHLPVPILSDRWWVVNQRINTRIPADSGVREMAWRPVPGGAPELPAAVKLVAGKGTEVIHTYGGWFLVDLGDDKTLVEFWTWSDPGGMVPAGLAANFAVSSVEDTLKRMTDLANKGPTCNL